MRVTNKMAVSNVLRNLRKPVESMLQRQAEVASGNRIQRPSDDPTVVARLQTIDSDLRAIGQYQRNVSSAQSVLRASESALADYETLITRAKELTVQAGNTSLDQGARSGMASEVDQMLEAMLALANRKTQGRYLFGGTNTRSEPFRATRNEAGEITSVQAGDISSEITRDVDEETAMSVNVPGSAVFGGDSNIFKTLIALRDALRSSDQTVVLATLDRLDALLDTSLDARVAVGAKMERLDSVQNQLADRELVLRQQKADLAEVDLAEALTELRAEEVAYQAALGAASRILSTSLVDFLR
jgi:flagellar hook-associated protein 3 FlgL